MLVSDMNHLYTRRDDESEWIWRMQSIEPSSLVTKGEEWKRLNFIDSYMVTTKHIEMEVV